MFRTVIVIGCPGAGKTTFAKALSAKSGLPLIHLDLLWHRPDRTTVSQAQFDAQLAAILAQDRWIIDGNYLRTLKLRLKACQAVFLFDLPVEACLKGAQQRIGTPRDDLPWQETEFDPEFRQWIMDFPKKQLPQVYDLLKQYQEGRTIVVFHSHQEADAYLKTTLPK
jgi:adenylate kinase family enzyme